jgi:A/G-specific adenine glycosylase
LAWFDAHKRDFPWRRDRDPYRTWICEVMSQQTTMAVVVPRFLAFVERLPTVEHLARCDDDTLRSLWSGLGYYARARNLRKGASHVVDGRGGRFPASYDEWLEVPGVGPYTASILASFSCGEPVACVDGNVVRVVSRLLALEKPAEVWSGEGQKRIHRFAQEELLSSAEGRARPGEFNEAMMELGATLCTRHSPQCASCPVRQACRAEALGRQDACPPPKPRRAQIPVSLEALCVVAIGANGGARVLLADRTRGFLKGTLGIPLVDELRFSGRPVSVLLARHGVDVPSGLLSSAPFTHTITHHALSGLGRVAVVPASRTSLLSSLEACVLEETGAKGVRWAEMCEVSDLLSSSLDAKAWRACEAALDGRLGADGAMDSADAACQNPA